MWDGFGAMVERKARRKRRGSGERLKSKTFHYNGFGEDQRAAKFMGF